jgi:hypothetical protein
MHAVLFVREFVAGEEQGCDPGLVGSTSAGEELERVPCVPVKPGSSPYGPYGIGANAFTWAHAGEMEAIVTFDGFAGSSTLVFSEEECARGSAWRSVSIYR